MGAYDTYTEQCSYCKSECDADWVDVGVGLVQCGPFHCIHCGASEIGPHDNIYNPHRPLLAQEQPKSDTRILTKQESETGWYEPHTPAGDTANVIHGKIVSHQQMKATYENEFIGNELWSDKAYVDDWWEQIRK